MLKRKTKINYRKIWEDFNGPIPKEPNGRSYQIHHIDGNSNNNDISNLQCITIFEHYQIHLAQGDKAAAARLAMAMCMESEKISKLCSDANIQRVMNGTHNLLKRADGTSVSKDRLSDSKYVNPFSKRADGTSVTSDRNQCGSNNNRYDSTIYKFKHLCTGNLIETTQHEMKKNFKLHPSNLSQMIKNPNGRIKSVNGWALIR
jgi:hypothetical protein